MVPSIFNAFTGHDPNDIGTVFVTSGSGVIGYRVAMTLLQAGIKVRVGVWKGDRQIGGDKSVGAVVSLKLQEQGAKVVSFDWSNEDDYEAAVAGCKTVFCTLPHMEGWADVFPSFLRVCKREKVENFVKISFYHAGQVNDPYRQNVPFVKFHGMCDDLLENSKYDSRINYTILCASHLMSTPLVHQGPILRQENKFVTASYGMGVNYVSPNDVADVAVAVLLNRKEHRNMTYNLTGPRPIRDKDVAKLLSKFYGTEIEHISLGYHDYKEDVKKRGHPTWLVKDSAAFERMKASGVEESGAGYTKDIETILGHKGETFKDYLDNKAAMTLQENPVVKSV